MIPNFTGPCNDRGWLARRRAFALIALVGLICLNISGCSKGPTHSLQGVASWYGYPHHGRLTASGRRFNMHELTAAHRTLPFGTRLQVTNLVNGRSVTVTITDRGPFVKQRVLDLSYAAARKIGMIGPGTAPVQLEVLEPSWLSRHGD
jgi:rare lipoprotein A (peptidoglycan hydrolase)